VPENLPSPHGDEPGHEVWTDVPENGDAGLRGFYALESDWTAAQESEIDRGTDAGIVIVNPELEERSNTSGPAAVETLGADYGTADADSDGELDGLPLYTYQDSDPAGTWRGIFMANDNGGIHSPHWRTHEPVRMLTANAPEQQGWGIYTFQYAHDWGDAIFHGHAAAGVTTIDGWGNGTWVMGWYPDVEWRVPHPVAGKLKLAWIATGVDPLCQEVEHEANENGREMTGSKRESTDLIAKIASDWLNAAGRAVFFSYITDGIPVGNWEELGGAYTSRQWGIGHAPAANCYNCAQFAGVVTERASPYVAATPLTLDLHVLDKHNDGALKYRYLRGIYSHEAQLYSCSCARCGRVRDHWPKEYFWDVD
jgi:hypothetical protein